MTLTYTRLKNNRSPATHLDHGRPDAARSRLRRLTADEQIEGKRDREVTDNERRYREMLEQGITGVENLPHPDAEKYLTHEWLPRARQALSGGDEDG